MSTIFRSMLLCLLTLGTMTACVEFDQDIDSYGPMETSQTLNKEANGDRPSAGHEPVRIVYATPSEETPLLGFPEPLAMILIDRTGSMIEIRDSTHNTRCLDAVAQAETQVAELSNSGAKSFAIWTFSGTTVVQRVTYITNARVLVGSRRFPDSNTKLPIC